MELPIGVLCFVCLMSIIILMLVNLHVLMHWFLQLLLLLLLAVSTFL